MKLLKKNQIIVYTIAVLLMVAGYLNYSTNHKDAVEASSQGIEKTNEYANVGDARLVNSSDIVEDTNTNTNNNNQTTNTTANATNETQNKNETNTNSNETVNKSENTTNESQSKDITTQTSSEVSDEYFVKSKLERDTMYSQMLETYEKVLNSSNSLETQKQSATKEITRINETKNSIMVCENLLQTKGFSNAVIFVNGESISIIIGTKELKPEEVSQIQNIISREMKANIENIHISTK